MSPSILALLAFVLLASALAGPVLITAAAPVLSRVPRLAVGALLAVPILWWGDLAALSLMSAWLFQGPDVLPVGVADVCQRCLIAANPFSAAGKFDTVVPVVVFLVLPVAIAAAFLVRGVVSGTERRRANLAATRSLRTSARECTVGGLKVTAVARQGLIAYSLPRRHGGIVVSDQLCEALDDDELAAVLEHEKAHIEEGHHLIIAAIDAFVRPCRRVPLFSAIAEAIPRYLEISADNAARRAAGTSALVRAVLKIGSQAGTGFPGDRLARAHALHVAGPDRIRQMVAPMSAAPGVLPAIALGSVLCAFLIVVAAVVFAYASVVVTGCVVP